MNESKIARKIRKSEAAKAEDMPVVFKVRTSDDMCNLLSRIQDLIIEGKSMYVMQLKNRRVKVESFSRGGNK